MREWTHGGRAAPAREVSRAVGAFVSRRHSAKLGINEGFLLQGAIAMLGYGIFFAAYDAADLAPLIAASALAFGSYVVGLYLSFRGSTNAAGAISLITPINVVLTFSWALSWAAGIHLMLLVGASAVFTALAPEWRGVRTTVVIANLLTFAAVQAFSTPETAWYHLPMSCGCCSPSTRSRPRRSCTCSRERFRRARSGRSNWPPSRSGTRVTSRRPTP
jgi:hypothetical protein